MSDRPDKRHPSRRDALKAMGAGAFGLSAAYGVTPKALERFYETLARGQYEYVFFTSDELAAMRILADMIIPRDEVSGSATDAGTVEYVDVVLSVSNDETQQRWRDGLTWLDAECRQRFTNGYVTCTDEQRGQVIDDIAWPRRAREELAEQVEWFNAVRNLVGSGFFSSEMGVRDLGYIGNVFNPNWQGAPQQALDELGVNYEEWDRRYGN